MQRKPDIKKKKAKEKIQKEYAVISIILAVYLLMIFFYITTSYTKYKYNIEMKDESRLILSRIIQDSNHITTKSGLATLSFVIKGEVDKARLISFANKNYEDIKSELGIKSDFCVYFENNEGNLIDISQFTGKNGFGIGKADISYNVISESGKIIGRLNCEG